MKRGILFLLTSAMISVLAGCGNSGSTFDVQNPPPPPPSNLDIKVQATPATGMILINSTAALIATVTGDTSNNGTGSGVDWSVTCASPGNCGSLSAPHTDSGARVTYTPPASFAGNSQSVNIVAFATADHSTNFLTSINVTAFGSKLSGTYILQTQGADANFNPYQFAGVVVLDGNGGIRSGEQTVNFSDPNTGLFVSKTEPIIPAGSSYFLGPDGRGAITINPNNDAALGTETLSFVFLSNSSNPRALISDFSNSVAPIQISGTGTMDLQDPKFQTTPPPTLLPGGYAFVVSGTDFVQAVPTAIGGILDINSSNNVVTNSSVMDEIVAINGIGAPPVADTVRPSGSVSIAPGPFGGVITLTLSAPFPKNPVQLTFTGYLVDDSHIRLIESDTDGSGSTAGLAIAQAAPPGSFTSFSGTYVFGVPGVDLNINYPSTLTSVGLFDADAASGYMDTFLQAYFNPITNVVGAQISATFNGLTVVDTKGIGRVRSPFTGFNPHPKPGFAPVFIFYLTSNGNCPSGRSCPALVLANGGNNYPFLGAGIAYPQSTALTFSGDYGFSFTEENGAAQYDGTAQMTAVPITTPPSLSGVADVSIFNGGAESNQPFRGTLGSPCLAGVANGCVTGTLANVSSNAFLSSNQPFPVDFYMIDEGDGLFVETDLLDPNNPSGVVSLGYYAARIPVCAGCQ